MILKDLYRRIVFHRWELGFIDNPLKDVIEGKNLNIKCVKFPFHGRWFADPFILDYDEKEIILLVEDYSDSERKGKISRLIIDRKTMELKDVKLILERDTHLSFPAIIRKKGKIFIYPENSAACTLNLYEYQRNTEVCKMVRQLSSEVMADAIISDYYGDTQLFSTKDNGNVLDIYKYDEESKSFVYVSNVIFKENIARNAGDFFEHNGKIYRPAQECNSMYGHAVSIQKIEKIGKDYKFTEVRRIMPPKGAFGIHTFNTYNGLIVIDMKVFRHPWLARPLFAIRNSLSFIIKHK